MEHTTITFLILMVAIFLFVAELLLPSGGILSVIAIALLCFVVVRMFSYSTFLGNVTLLTFVVSVPIGMVYAVRNLHRLPFGRKIIPPNPDKAPINAEEARPELVALIGQTGSSTSPLHPVGICSFDGKLVQCVAEMGIIDAHVEVVVTAVKMNELVVRPVSAA